MFPFIPAIKGKAERLTAGGGVISESEKLSKPCLEINETDRIHKPETSKFMKIIFS